VAVATYSKSGAKSQTPAKLPANVFGEKDVNHQLLKDAYLAYSANGRANLAVTKKRGEVSGGGRKPWRQKGTGRARFGSSRNPIWTGGGVAFGPSGNENYSRKLNVKAKRTALRHALSLAAAEDRIKIIETFACPEGKIKPTLDLLNKIDAKGKTLIVVSIKDDLVDRATRNITNVRATQANFLNVPAVLDADTVVISKKSIDVIQQWLGGNRE